MAAIAQTTITTSSRAPLIRQLLWVSMDSSMLFFAVSTIAWGSQHSRLPRVTALATAAFELALLWMDSRNQTRSTSESPEHGTPSPGANAPNLAAEEEAHSQSLRQPTPLPLACRKWAIGLRTFLVLGWACALVLVIMQQVFVRIPSAFAILKTIWIGFQLGVVGTLYVICFLEQQHAVRI